jgi:hypothetical protein
MSYPRRRRPFRKHNSPRFTAPEPLSRVPSTDLQIRVEDLDRRTFAAVDLVSARLEQRIDHSSSLDELRLLVTKNHLLEAMKSTHRSIVQLVGTDQDLAVDALPLTRMQLERTFLALLIEDQPGRWYKRYRKNAWKAFAEKFFRDQKLLGQLPPYQEYFDCNGPGIKILRDFAREMDVWEDEFQTLRVMVRGEQMDPRWEKRFIADMPTPGKALHLLERPIHKKLATLLYPYYDSLSHFSHGGLAGVMEAAILRQDPAAQDSKIDRSDFFRSTVLEQTLPLSYVASIFVTSLTALNEAMDAAALEVIDTAWQPYHSDGSALGIALWDHWARDALAAALEESPQAQPSADSKDPD